MGSMEAEENSTFTISKRLMGAFKREAKSRGQKLRDYIDDLVLVFACADSKVWEEA
jgi:hypothetical protein